MKNGRRHLGRAAIAWLAAPRPSALTLMPKNIGIMGYHADRIAHARKDWYREDMRAVLDLCAKGVIKPLIEKELPLCDAQHAHELLGTAQCTGKIVLRASATSALESC